MFLAVLTIIAAMGLKLRAVAALDVLLRLPGKLSD